MHKGDEVETIRKCFKQEILLIANSYALSESS